MICSKSISNRNWQNVEKEDIIETRRASLPDDALLWTGSKRALIELIYALEANGDFNRGNASLKEIAEYFEIIFHIEIGDLYHAYLEMRGRKNKPYPLFGHFTEKLTP